MASLVGGSNLGHRSPESHYLVRSQRAWLTSQSAAVRLGVESAAQGIPDLQLRSQAFQSEGTPVAKHQLGLELPYSHL